MAKKLSALDALKSLPRSRIGCKPWRETLAPDQRREYEAVLKHLRETPRADWPAITDILASLESAIGRSPCINTLKTDVARG